MSQNNIVLEYSDVSFSYNSKVLFDKISFEIRNREITIIFGKSGKGKSTLLKLTNRLLETSGGIIRYLGQDIKTISPLILREKIGYLAQIPYLIEGSVKDNLLLPFSKKKIVKNNDEELAKVISEVGLTKEYLNRNSQELSVGEKQRISLVRTLLNEPRVLLLDEPNSALDGENSQILIDTLKKIVKEKSVSLLVVTHQIDFAMRLGNRFLLLEDSKIKGITDPKNAFIPKVF